MRKTGSLPHERTKTRRWPTTSQEEGPHPEPKLFAFLTSRTVRDKCLLLKHPGCGICYSSLNGSRQLSYDEFKSLLLLLYYEFFSKKKWVRWLDLHTWTRNVKSITQCSNAGKLQAAESGIALNIYKFSDNTYRFGTPEKLKPDGTGLS